MIEVYIWTKEGAEYEVVEMPPSEIKIFIDLIKEYGVDILGETYSFVEAMYNPEVKVFDITVE